MREHRALGATGRAAGIENPGNFPRIGVSAIHRCGLQQLLITEAAGHCDEGHGRQIGELAGKPFDQCVACEQRTRATVSGDVRDFLGMKLGVDRHGT